MEAESGQHGRDLLDGPDAGPQAARGGAMRAGGYAVGTLLDSPRHRC